MNAQELKKLKRIWVTLHDNMPHVEECDCEEDTRCDFHQAFQDLGEMTNLLIKKDPYEDET